MYAPVAALVAGVLLFTLLSGLDLHIPRKPIVGVIVLTAAIGGLLVLGNLFFLIGLLAAALALGGVLGFMANAAALEQLKFKLEQAKLTRAELEGELRRIQDHQQALARELSSSFVQSQSQFAQELAKTQ